jgi:hypothetical protein
VNFARRVFLIAGIYGLIVMLPQYFLESKTSHDYPPALTHPEFYYGFIGVTLAWQVLFLVLSRDPIRFRAMIIPGILEKISFPIAMFVLFLQHRIAPLILGPAMIDLVLAGLFVVAYFKTPELKGSPG